MQLKLDKRFWVVITCIIVVFTIFIVGRNLLHAIEIRKDIAILEQERAIYRARIEQDSTLLEELKYDDNLADVCPLHASADILVAITNVLSPVSAAASVVYPALFTALIFTM